MAHQRVWKVLERVGMSRPERTASEQGRRYERPCPGDRLHMDTKRDARLTSPGHAVTGDRTKTSAAWVRLWVPTPITNSNSSANLHGAVQEIARADVADQRPPIAHTIALYGAVSRREPGYLTALAMLVLTIEPLVSMSAQGRSAAPLPGRGYDCGESSAHHAAEPVIEELPTRPTGSQP